MWLVYLFRYLKIALIFGFILAIIGMVLFFAFLMS